MAPLIRIVSRSIDRAQIRLGDCETVVTLRVSRDDKGAPLIAPSHWIRPPRAARQRQGGDMRRNETLGAAIAELAYEFWRGLNCGHSPEESWFVLIPTLVTAPYPHPPSWRS